MLCYTLKIKTDTVTNAMQTVGSSHQLGDYFSSRLTFKHEYKLNLQELKLSYLVAKRIFSILSHVLHNT